MTDPRIVTDADTVARLAKKARAIEKILGDDTGIVMLQPDDPATQPWIAAVADSTMGNSWVAVAIEGGDVWHWPGPDAVQASKAAPDTVPAVVQHQSADGPRGRHLADGGASCICLGPCCNDRDENCICGDCVDPGHQHLNR